MRPRRRAFDLAGRWWLKGGDSDSRLANSRNSMPDFGRREQWTRLTARSASIKSWCLYAGMAARARR